MYRSIFSIGLFLIIYGLLGLLVPHAALSLTFLLPDGVPTVSSVMLGILLCNFAVVSYFRKPFYKLLFGIMGTALALIGLLGITEPTFFGIIYYTARPADLLVAIQSGIGLLLASLEYERPAFYIEMGIPYRKYLRFIVSRPTVLVLSFNKRAALAAANLGIVQPT